MKFHRTRLTLAPALLAMTFAATAAYAQDTTSRSGTQDERLAAGALTDGQILQIVKTLNDGEIKQANVAKDEADNAEVKQLAETIITDHENANEEIDKLLDGATNLDDSALADSLAAEAEKSHERLQDVAGAQYDCAYLQIQVAQHEKAINIAKTQLTPNAKNAGVKQFLTATGPKLEHHLEMAKMGRDQAGCS